MSEYPFNPNPQAENHMCHWKVWADHFKNAEGDIGKLARMLGYCWEEFDKMRSDTRKNTAHAELLFAFIKLVETGKPVPFSKEVLGIGSAFSNIETLNKWRAENKLNIKQVDV